MLGGARSGKSRHAQILAMATPPPWIYVATAEALDEEMGERIAKHKAARGEGWSTIEAPIDLARAVTDAPAERAGRGRLPHAVALQSDARPARR